MNRVLASVTAPILLYLLAVIYTLIDQTMSDYTISHSFSLSEFLIVYFFSLPFFLLIGIPISIVIDKISKRIRWLSYTVGGGVIGLIIMLKNNIDRSNFYFETDSVFVYPAAGLAFFLSLKVMEMIFQKLNDRYIS